MIEAQTSSGGDTGNNLRNSRCSAGGENMAIQIFQQSDGVGRGNIRADMQRDLQVATGCSQTGLRLPAVRPEDCLLQRYAGRSV